MAGLGTTLPVVDTAVSLAADPAGGLPARVEKNKQENFRADNYRREDCRD